MKHTFTLRLAALASIVAATATLCTSCGGDDDDDKTWETYAQWREANDAFYNAQREALDEDGQPLYEQLVPAWNSGAEILIKWLGDRTLTQGNLVPMETSQVEVKYIGRLFNGVPFDSSYTRTDSAWQTNVSSVIEGWRIALQYMHVGDSVRIVVPYWLGYGASTSTSFNPYSTLLFDLKLKDIVDWQSKP